MENIMMEKLQKRILEEMKQHGDSQKTLADKIGVTASDMSKLLNGGRNISIEKLVSIADAYGLSIDDMLDRSKSMTTRDVCRALVRIDQKLRMSITPTGKDEVLPYDNMNVLTFGKPGHYEEYSIVFTMYQEIDCDGLPDYDRYIMNKFIGDYARLRKVFSEDQERLTQLTDALIDNLY